MGTFSTSSSHQGPATAASADEQVDMGNGYGRPGAISFLHHAPLEEDQPRPIRIQNRHGCAPWGGGVCKHAAFTACIYHRVVMVVLLCLILLSIRCVFLFSTHSGVRARHICVLAGSLCPGSFRTAGICPQSVSAHHKVWVFVVRRVGITQFSSPVFRCLCVRSSLAGSHDLGSGYGRTATSRYTPHLTIDVIE